MVGLTSKAVAKVPGPDAESGRGHVVFPRTCRQRSADDDYAIKVSTSFPERVFNSAESFSEVGDLREMWGSSRAFPIIRFGCGHSRAAHRLGMRASFKHSFVLMLPMLSLKYSEANCSTKCVARKVIVRKLPRCCQHPSHHYALSRDPETPSRVVPPSCPDAPQSPLWFK